MSIRWQTPYMSDTDSPCATHTFNIAIAKMHVGTKIMCLRLKSAGEVTTGYRSIEWETSTIQASQFGIMCVHYCTMQTRKGGVPFGVWSIVE